MRVEKRDGQFVIILNRFEAEELYRDTKNNPVNSGTSNLIYKELLQVLPLHEED